MPGASGLDDAIQVVVEIGDQPGNPFSNSTRLYTYLRDEMGTVVGVVAEEETPPSDGTSPLPVRYLYTPYGSAHAEVGPELRRARFDNDRSSGGGVDQAVAAGATGGAMVLEWSIGLEATSLADGIAVERLVSGSGWVALSAVEAVVALENGEELPRVVALATNGWVAGASYRVRVRPDLVDTLGRPFRRTESLEWRVPSAAEDGSIAPVVFEKRYVVTFDSTVAAASTVGGRFPSGQPMLFQGLWTDPVTGISYARARWYDSRNAVFLSEDPLLDISSPNLYAYVGWQPSMLTDPTGECPRCVYERMKRGAEVVAHATEEAGLAAARLGGWGVGLGKKAATVVWESTPIAMASGGFAEAKLYLDTYRAGDLSDVIILSEDLAAARREQLPDQLLGLVPGVATVRASGDAMEVCGSDRGFACGMATGEATGQAMLDATFIYGGVKLIQSRSAVRPATQQPRGGNGVVLQTGEGATAAEMAASRGGPTGGTRAGQSTIRQELLDEVVATGEPYQCWRCGQTTTNPQNMQVGHRNVSVSEGGNMSRANVCLEGAACNLSAGNRAAPKPGRSCAERGSCGAPFGRND